RKAKVVISHEVEDLISKDPSKQGRMSETEYEDVETEHAEKESSEVHLDVLRSETSQWHIKALKIWSKYLTEKILLHYEVLLKKGLDLQSLLKIWRKLYGYDIDARQKVASRRR
ncbi:hypothetical protein Tco_0102179, partial [Tanacetum coccineum]